ncbi:MAG: tRNA (guanosine(46)-N7)-methyltransferase TrmB [Candidatus Omnitrophica bacterium]|nr:tRNA (guanosine(46)-N7)-methyltransferase TrmB [Candidatus Omnitrophota bacterium]
MTTEKTAGDMVQEVSLTPQGRKAWVPPPPRLMECPFPDFLGSSSPFEIEIGCGKGKFIAARAERNKSINFAAIDKAGKYLKRRKLAAQKKGLTNLKFLVADAREVLRQHVPSGRVSIFHIYFPDPWPKRRHRDRRLVTAELLQQLYDRLKPGGLLYAATDDGDYFQAIMKAVAASGCPWQVREARNTRLTTDVDLPMTNYENRFFTAGRDLHYLELKKI